VSGSLREDADRIWSAGLAAVAPERLVADHASVIDATLTRDTAARILVVGGGKAAAGVAAGIETLLGPDALARQRVSGLVSVPEGCGRRLSRIEIRETRPAGLNLPTPEVVKATAEMLTAVAALGPDDLVIVPLTGGGSALLAAPKDGVTLDELLIYLRAPGVYLLCINAGNIAADLAWMARQAEGFDVTVTDRSADYALLAIQGPASAAIVQSLTGAKLGLLANYTFCEGTVAGVQCLISRTGYTGEDGFELYHAPADAPALAEALLAAGAPHGLELAGLGARDSLRLEAGFPLHGHELSPAISPLAAGLGWTVKLAKARPCLAHAALAREKAEGSPRRVVFFRTGDRRIVRAETPVTGTDGAPVGRVLSGTLSPILNEAIGSALVDTAAIDGPLNVEIRGTAIALLPVRPPFVPLRRG
jgi:aminomethyltransferase